MGFVLKENTAGGLVREIKFFPGKDRKTGELCLFRLKFSLFEVLLSDGEDVVQLRVSFRGGVNFPKFTLQWPQRLERPMVDIGRDRGLGRGRKVPDMLAELEWVSGKREEYDKREIVGQLELMGLNANFVLGLVLARLAKFV